MIDRHTAEDRGFASVSATNCSRGYHHNTRYCPETKNGLLDLSILVGLFAVLTATTCKLSTPGHASRQMDPDKCLLPSYGAVACGVEVDSLGTTARKSNMKYIGVDLCPVHGQPTNIVIHCQKMWTCSSNLVVRT